MKRHKISLHPETGAMQDSNSLVSETVFVQNDTTQTENRVLEAGSELCLVGLVLNRT